MAGYASALSEGSPSVGRVIARAFASITATPRTVLGIALTIGAVPTVVLTYAMPQLPLGGDGAAMLGFGGASLAMWIVTSLLSVLAHGALVHVAVAYLQRGTRAGLADSLVAAVRVLLPLTLLSVTIFILTMIGLTLLIVPGVMLYVTWSVATPALVTEGGGIGGALGRSRALTKGARWPVFGLQLIVIVMFYMILGSVGVGAIAANGGARGLAAGDMSIGLTALNAVLASVASAVWSTIQAALYVELRDWKDGPDADHLVDVFA